MDEDEDERSELRAFLASGEMEDGRISDTELQRLREIIRVLQLDAVRK